MENCFLDLKPLQRSLGAFGQYQGEDYADEGLTEQVPHVGDDGDRIPFDEDVDQEITCRHDEPRDGEEDDLDDEAPPPPEAGCARLVPEEECVTFEWWDGDFTAQDCQAIFDVYTTDRIGPDKLKKR